MTLNEHIANFLRDAQYRVAQLGIEMDELDDEGNYQYKELYKQILRLELFMSVLYKGMWKIVDNYNHIQIVDGHNSDDKTTWTEREIIQEIERLRYECSMNEVPFITFTGHYPIIVQQVLGGSGSGGSGFTPPAGQYRQFLMYNLAGVLVPVTFSEYGGQLDTEGINDYFINRP